MPSMPQFLTRALPAAALALCAAPPVRAQTEIQWWHSMTAVNNEWVNDLAKQFNESQKEYKIIPTFKGSYSDSFIAAIAAYRAGQAPHILQVFEVGTATMMASKGATVPVGKVMKDAGFKFDPAAYIPAVAGYYTAPSGEMLSFPFNSRRPCSTSTRTPSRPPASTRPGCPPPGPTSRLPRPSSNRRPQVPDDHRGGAGPSSRASTWHNTELATKKNGPPAGTRGSWPTLPLHVRHIENLGKHGQTGHLRLQGPRQHPRGDLRLR